MQRSAFSTMVTHHDEGVCRAVSLHKAVELQQLVVALPAVRYVNLLPLAIASANWSSEGRTRRRWWRRKQWQEGGVVISVKKSVVSPWASGVLARRPANFG